MKSGEIPWERLRSSWNGEESIQISAWLKKVHQNEPVLHQKQINCTKIDSNCTLMIIIAPKLPIFALIKIIIIKLGGHA